MPRKMKFFRESINYSKSLNTYSRSNLNPGKLCTSTVWSEVKSLEGLYFLMDSTG